MKHPPDDQHLQIESVLRGICNLLPEDGLGKWQVVESKKRNKLTKIVRMIKNGRPALAFERLGKPINVWLPKDSFDSCNLSLPPPVVRSNETLTGSKNPGYHSNIHNFFEKPEEMWFIQLSSVDEFWTLLKSL